MATKMKIEIWSDVVCPFCYIGKRNFEAALYNCNNLSEIDIEWKSYQLDPNASNSSELRSYPEHLAAKYGWSIEKAKESIASVTAMAEMSGLEFRLGNAKPFNTTDTHKVIQYAKSKGLGDQVEEAFFKAYFTDEKDLTKKEILLEIIQNIGLTDVSIETVLNDSQYAAALNSDLMQAQQLGIRGVPFFVFNRKYALSGAQTSEVFTEVLNTSFAEWKTDMPVNISPNSDGQSCDINGNCG
ncbi:MAG: DsbA family oxidoreductase [Saprospiraceae bacterium]|nr:DsbA family oxidoreductase [Saprospiraceae bacterium]